VSSVDSTVDVSVRLHELRVEARGARARADEGAEAALQLDIASFAIAANRPGEARNAVVLARRLFRRTGSPGGIAQATYMLAVLDARTPEGRPAARRHFTEARQAARSAGDMVLAARALERLGRLHAQGDEVEAAAIALAEAVAELRLAGEPERAAEVAAQRALMLVLDEPRAGIVASRSDTPESVDVSRELRADATAALAGSPLEGYGELAEAASQLEAGGAGAAVELAGGARRTALEHADPVLYLLACLLEAQAREAQGDRVACLTALFTCGATLADLLGEDARTPVLAVIDSLRRDWGDEAFETLMTRYRAQFTDGDGA